MFLKRFSDWCLSPRISDLLDQWVDERGGSLPSADANQRAVRNLKTSLNRTRLRDYDSRVQDVLIDEMREKGWGAAYINRNLTVLRASFGHAKRKHRVNLIPTITLLDGVQSKEKNIFSADQLAEFIDRSRTTPHLFRFMMLSANTAARPTTVLEIGTRQVFLKEGYINLNLPGRRQTKKYRPIVPVTRAISPWLKQWTSSPIVNWRGQPVINIKNSFSNVVDQMALDVSPSCIRHTMATELAKAAVPKEQRDRFMGHRAPDGSRVGERYLHLDPTYLNQARDAIDAYFEMLPIKTWRHHL